MNARTNRIYRRKLPSEISTNEHREQVAFFAWAEVQAGPWPELKLMFSIPNAAKRSHGEAAYMLAEGLKKGVPDVFLSVPRGEFHGLYIEFKCRETGGKLKPEQRDWMRALRGQGYAAEVAWSCEDAIKITTGYLREAPYWTWGNDEALDIIRKQRGV